MISFCFFLYRLFRSYIVSRILVNLTLFISSYHRLNIIFFALKILGQTRSRVQVTCLVTSTLKKLGVVMTMKLLSLWFFFFFQFSLSLFLFFFFISLLLFYFFNFIHRLFLTIVRVAFGLTKSTESRQENSHTV